MGSLTTLAFTSGVFTTFTSFGAAAAWAATQTPLITLTTFAAIGGGLALPYLLLSALPKLVNRMPKAGPASELIEQVMGLFMLAAAAYFFGVGVSALLRSPLNPPSKIFWWPVMFCSIAAGGWLAYRTLQITSRVKLRTLFTGAGLLVGNAPRMHRLRGLIAHTCQGQGIACLLENNIGKLLEAAQRPNGICAPWPGDSG